MPTFSLPFFLNKIKTAKNMYRYLKKKQVYLDLDVLIQYRTKQ